MRRVVGVFAAVTLVVGASGLGIAGTAGSTVDYPILQVKKVVTGTPTVGFTVTVACSVRSGSVTAQNPQPPDATLTFNADGTPNTADNMNWQSVAGNWQFQNSTLISAVCTVTETGAGGASSVSYACAFTNGAAITDASQQNGVGGCSGPVSGPTVVTYSDNNCTSSFCALGQSATVTVTNTFPVITAITQDANTVLVTGSGFPPNTESTVDIQSTPLVLGTLTADANGAFSKAFTIPCSVGSGSHTVTATATTGQTASTGVTLAACPVVAPINFTG